jgi:hypothetical protein
MMPLRCTIVKYLISIVLLLFSTLLVLINPTPSRAEEASIGTITKVKGEATVTRSDGQEVSASKGLALFPGDAIATGKDGVVSLLFHEGDFFRINEDSQVTLDELTASEEDNPPVLRLSLGFLWSKLKLYLNKPTRQVINTPTAVIGVRGTEFDTVVAEDSSSTIAVDAGSVEVEAEEAKLVVEQGQSTEVDPKEKILPPEKAVPRDKRDWQKFRRERAEMLIKNLPQNSPRIRKRFEREVNRYLLFTKRIHERADRVNSHIKQFYDARRKKDRRAAREQLKEIKSQEKQFRPMAFKFRKALNRVRVMGRSTAHIKMLFERNRDRFSPADLAVIEPNLSVVSKKLKELRRASDLTIANIKRTYRDLRRLRRLIERRREEETRREGTGDGFGPRQRIEKGRSKLSITDATRSPVFG